MVSVDSVRQQSLADQVTAKLHNLLKHMVLVANCDGVVIAASHAQYVGQSLDAVASARQIHWLRLPLPLDADRLTGELVIEQPAEVDPAVTRLTGALVEMVVNEVMFTEWLPDKTEVKNKFIYDTLLGKVSDTAVLHREAQILGMDLSQPRSVILINARDYIFPSGEVGKPNDATSLLRTRQRARFVIASIVGYFNLPDDTICAHIGDGEIVVLKSISRQTLQRWSDDAGATCSSGWVDLPALRRAAGGLLKRLHNDTNESISIGIGRYHAGVDGLARSYNDARIALSVGNHYHGQDRVHSIDDLGLAAFIGGADERTKHDLAEHLLDPLRNEPDLMQTLVTYFEERCCPTQTVERLAIHRNTLRLRLQKIATLVGLDPQDFEEAIQLRLALLVTSLSERQVSLHN